MISVEITETTVYSKRYDRPEIVALLVKDGGWKESDLLDMTEEQLAGIVGGPAGSWTVEEDMQGHGEVAGTQWKVWAS